MRIKQDEITLLKDELFKIVPKAEIYLFGSRTDDAQKGGDIDILVIADKKLSFTEKTRAKIPYYKKFGDQKIDIVSFQFNEISNFKEMILQTAIKL